MHVKHILCAIDFSSSAKRAMEHAVLLAQALHPEIRLLHVYQRSAGHAITFSTHRTGNPEQKFTDH
jgi:nucleotide-binding universal stress UspA family protein